MFKYRGELITVKTTNTPVETNKGVPLVMHTVSSIAPDKTPDFRIESYLRDKYSSFDPNFATEEHIGSLTGSVYKKRYEFDDLKPKKVEDFIDDLRGKDPEYFITLIKVDKEMKGKGVGTVMLEFSEYLFAKYLHSAKKKEGLVRGQLVPFDMSKYQETKRFYTKNGYSIYPYVALNGQLDEILYKKLNAEEVLDRDSRKVFERSL